MASKPTEPADPRFITGARLRRFKACHDSGTISLSNFNLVIGRNGSGKSTLVEALQWIDAEWRTSPEEACDRYFGIGNLLYAPTAKTERSFDLNLAMSGFEIGIEYADKSEKSVQPRFFDGRAAEGKAWIDWIDWIEWRKRWVFLKISPSRIGQGPLRPARLARDPLIDEEGANLPILLRDLSSDQRKELIQRVGEVVDDIDGVTISKPRFSGLDSVRFGLKQRFPATTGKRAKSFEIPAWMLSEGTRRLTAIFALLVHDPAPSLLCIEEIENGLDPWAVIKVVNALRAASKRGTQVILTTHSPWLLDHVDLNDIIHVRRENGEPKYRRFADEEEIKQFQDSIPPGARYVNTSKP